MADEAKTRIFIYDGKEYPDPDPNMKPDEVRQSMAQFFPELSNAETKEGKKGDAVTYTFTKRVGTKGAKCKVEVEIPDGKVCFSADIQPGCIFVDQEWPHCCLMGKELQDDNGSWLKADGCPNPPPADIPTELPAEYPVCTCGVCPKLPPNQIITGAFHDSDINKLIPQKDLCQWHKEHGNEGIHYQLAVISKPEVKA